MEANQKQSDIQRFMSFVNRSVPSGCWLWTGTCTQKGYGRFWFEGGKVGAHRVAYQLFAGPLPVGSHVLHKCDVKNCVNPEHLEIGTNAQNHADAAERGLHQKKLTELQVLCIKMRHSLGRASQRELARRYRVSQTMIHYIVTGKWWSWV